MYPFTNPENSGFFISFKRMYKTHLIFYLIFLFIYSSCRRQEFSVKVSIPQNSGLAAPLYKAFEIKDGKLYEINEFLWDTLMKPQILKTYKIDDSLIEKIKKVISATDSLGHHTGMCEITLGWPRFFISFNDNGRKREGFVANVYREHVYRIIDVFNQVIPDYKIKYDKEELIEREKKCKEDLLNNVSY